MLFIVLYIYDCSYIVIRYRYIGMLQRSWAKFATDVLLIYILHIYFNPICWDLNKFP